MPARRDIESILLIGSGPIVIGQGCEFDYSGSQAAKVLRRHGYRVILVNSNPATIMTDPDFADATYIEPLTPASVAAIIAAEKPDALLPTLGGQTALNVTSELAGMGRLDTEVIGASIDAIAMAEDREQFRTAMEEIGIATPRAGYARSLEESRVVAADFGFPLMVRPSYILGGGGTGIAHGQAELDDIVTRGLQHSPVGEVLVEESLAGWKEYELEVMRDVAGNAVIVCGIENIDPMGVHTGDSITVAPIQTLSDREYQEMRTEAIACLNKVGIETGGSNVQFAVDPASGRRVIIEMNPRVSRSSALASKATGFPIAKIAALLAVGYTLDEIPNDITGATPASFEPVLDYVVVKAPRFDFGKFPAASGTLGTSMQSVGEAMAIGRTFPEALQKALRSLEDGRAGLNCDPGELAYRTQSVTEIVSALERPTADRLFLLGEALYRGADPDKVAAVSGIDPWFVDQIGRLVAVRDELGLAPSEPAMRLAKSYGYSDQQLSYLWNVAPGKLRARRRAWGIETTFHAVDTCAAEFEALTPYFYSGFEEENETPPPGDRTVVVLGSGPNRIGQGIEFDYCCVHASFALRDAGYEPVMINCNPETVSTDYDTSSRLYFEPLTAEDVLAVIDKEQPEGVIVQLGGQTPLNLAPALAQAGVNILGTSTEAIDIAEDRERFSALCAELGLRQPAHGIARSPAAAHDTASDIGFPVLVRPSYVLGGRSMRVIYDTTELDEYLRHLTRVGGGVDLEEAPLLIDRFLENATEVDVDAVYDGEDLLIGGLLEHAEEAGVHSGDSTCVLPPSTISRGMQDQIADYTKRLAGGLGVRGLLNLQLAVRDDELFVLEANPRASRTVPFVSKATGIPLAKIATRVMLGESIADLRRAGIVAEPRAGHTSVKKAVLPWDRFPAEDVVLGPEMRATGEVMGIAPDYPVAVAKAEVASGHRLPEHGTLFLSLTDKDKSHALSLAKRALDYGFRLLVTAGTAAELSGHQIPVTVVDKVGEGSWDPVQLIDAGMIDLVINTPQGRRARSDGRLIRRAAHRAGIPCITTPGGASAFLDGLGARRSGVTLVKPLQDYHR